MNHPRQRAADARAVIPSVTVRRARHDEYAQAGAIAVAGYLDDGLLSHADGSYQHYAPQLRDAAGRDAGAEVWVALAHDAVRGTVTWCPPGSPWREVAHGHDQGEFRMLAVAPEARRSGIARALVEACVARARADGMREIRLSSLPEMTAAHALYGSLGFVRAPELDHCPTTTVRLWAFRLEL